MSFCNVHPPDQLSELRQKLFKGGRLVKFQGVACSVAPQASHLSVGALLAALGLSLGGLGFSSAALAGACVQGPPGTWVCSGTAAGGDSTQALSVAGPITVTANPGFGLETNAGNGFNLSSNGKLDFNVGAASIAAPGDGVFAVNNGSGEMTVKVGRIVSGVDGVYAGNTANGTDVTIDAQADVSGGVRGIFVDNGSATGKTTINSKGTVSSGSSEGIFVSHAGAGAVAVTAERIVSGGTGITTIKKANAAATAASGTTVEVGSVTSQGRGIDVTDNSQGAIAIKTTGVVTAQGDRGISAVLSPNGTDVTIDARADVSGAGVGILATSQSATGKMTINSKGTASGGSSDGIYVVHAGAGLVINAENTKGGLRGIYVEGVGSGGLDLTSTGKAEGGSRHGIIIVSNSNSTYLNMTVAEAQGGINGIYINHRSAQGTANNDATIHVSGVIQGGTGAGIFTQSQAGVMTRINIADTATVQATSGTAVFNNAGDSITTVAKGAKVAGAFSLGAGSDHLILNGTDNSNITVFDGGDDASSADGSVDTLTFNGVGDEGRYAVRNWEVINLSEGTNLSNTGRLETEQVNVTKGSTFTGSGQFALSGNLAIDATSRFVVHGAGQGNYTVGGSLANAGLVSLADGAVGDRLRVGGNYTGGGQLAVDVDFASGQADQLVVAGSVTGPATALVINDVTAANVANPQDVTVVTAAGGVAPGAYSLANGAFSRGIWNYDLVNRTNDVVLKRGGVNALAAAYEGTPAVLLNSFASLPTLAQRVGQRQWARPGDSAASAFEGLWVRIHGGSNELRPSSSVSGYSSKATTTTVQVGADFMAQHADSGSWVVGATGQYGRVNSTMKNAAGRAKVEGTGYGLGLTASWHGANGAYVDSQVQVNRVSVDVSTDRQGQLVNGNHRTALAAGVEVGQHFDVSERKHWLVPQAQLSWGRMGSSTLVDSVQNQVRFDSAEQLVARLGVAYQFRPSGELRSSDMDGKMLYVIGNILHDFASTNGVSVNGVALGARGKRSWAEVGVGGSAQLNKNALFYGELAYRSALGSGSSGNKDLSANVGIRVNW